MPIWLIFSLSTAVVWSVGQILAKKGLSHISPLWNNIFANGFSFILWIPTVLFLSHFRINVPPLQILIAVFLTGLTYMFFFYAIAKGEVSLTASLLALYPIATIVLSNVFLNEKITSYQGMGILLALMGAVFIALPEKRLPVVILKDKSWIIWGSVTAIISGVGDFLAKLTSNAIGAYSQIFFLAIMLQVLSTGNFLLDKKGRKLPKFSTKTFLPTILGTFFTITGTMLFFLAFKYGPVSLIGPASSVFPAITAILATVFLKEKISKKQMAGIGSIIIGITLIGLKT